MWSPHPTGSMLCTATPICIKSASYIYIECGCNTIVNPSGCNQNLSTAWDPHSFSQIESILIVSIFQITKETKGSGTFPLTRCQMGKPTLTWSATCMQPFPWNPARLGHFLVARKVSNPLCELFAVTENSNLCVSSSILVRSNITFQGRDGIEWKWGQRDSRFVRSPCLQMKRFS
jgi:hypothetical protein